MLLASGGQRQYSNPHLVASMIRASLFVEGDALGKQACGSPLHGEERSCKVEVVRSPDAQWTADTIGSSPA